jgi:parallel beta-helix repeat protein
MRKKGIKFTFVGIVLFLGIYLIFFIPNGKSNPDTGITNCTNLTIPGEKYFLSNDIHNDQINYNCMNISDANITLDCRGHYIFSKQNYSGIYSNSINTTIKNCNITMGSGRDSNAMGIHFDGFGRIINGTFAGAANGTIFNNSIFGDTLYGINIDYSSYNNITSNIGISNLSYGINLFPSSHDNILRNNIEISNFSVGINLDDSSNGNLLINNTAISYAGEGISFHDSDTNTLISNTGISNLGDGIYFSFHSVLSVLINNTGISNLGYGIVSASSYNSFTSNIGISNSSAGIYLILATYDNINSNMGISNSGPGISMNYSINNTLNSNIGISNSSAGIYLDYCINNTINNSISNNNKYGIYLSYSNGTIVTNLTAKNNSLYGVFLEGSSYLNVIKNSFIQLSNGSAFSLNNSVNSPQNNSFYNNYFNNSVASSNLSASSKNYFNTTKTSGINIAGGNFLAGNYWAAPNGTGFSQTCTDEGDGICNISYNLDGINFDYLPLVCHENWGYSDWGSCINNIQTRIYYDSNLCQTYKNYNPGILSQSCGTIDTGGHTVPNQGSQGGGGATTFTQSVTDISSVQPVEITINNSGMDLSSLTINVKNSVSDTSVNITTVNQTESGLPIGRVYQAFEIDPGIDNSNIINATINFKINKTWLAENNITFHSKGNRSWLVEDDIVGNIILYRNPEGSNAWMPLVTTFSSEDNQYYYFSAYSPGFSTFAIFLNRYDCLPNSVRCENNEVQLCLGNSTWLVTDHCSDTCGNGKCTSSFFKSDQFYFILITIVIGVIAIIMIVLLNKIRSVYKPYSKF